MDAATKTLDFISQTVEVRTETLDFSITLIFTLQVLVSKYSMLDLYIQTSSFCQIIRKIQIKKRKY